MQSLKEVAEQISKEMLARAITEGACRAGG